jgi:hypothetical protein
MSKLIEYQRQILTPSSADLEQAILIDDYKTPL